MVAERTLPTCRLTVLAVETVADNAFVIARVTVEAVETVAEIVLETPRLMDAVVVEVA
jgi:hypothetical protein